MPVAVITACTSCGLKSFCEKYQFVSMSLSEHVFETSKKFKFVKDYDTMWSVRSKLAILRIEEQFDALF